MANPLTKKQLIQCLCVFSLVLCMGLYSLDQMLHVKREQLLMQEKAEKRYEALRGTLYDIQKYLDKIG